jgi:chromosome segregation ATPase
MKLSQITLDPKLMMRKELNQEIVDEYAQAMLDGDKFPDIVIFNDGEHNYLVEGFKRYYAAKKSGLEIISADVQMGTYDDAFDYALTVANRKNGEHYSNEDKRYQLSMALEVPRYKEKSDRELARILKVSNPFVSKMRKATGNQPEAITIKRGDQEYKMANPAKEPVNAPASEKKPTEEDKIFEMATEIESMAADLEAAERRVAVAAMDATPEEKELAATKLEEMATEIKNLNENNRVLRISRDSKMNDVAERDKQIHYWKSRWEKADKRVNQLEADVKVWKDRALTAEAHLEINAG